MMVLRSPEGILGFQASRRPERGRTARCRKPAREEENMLDDREKDETENVSIEDLIEDSIEENERAEDSQTVAPAKPDRKDDSDDGYEKICYVCRRPESKAGPMITMPGGMNFCHDCMQKAFWTQ